MKRLLAALILLLTPSLAAGQYAEPVELLAGKRIRAKLLGPEGPWAYGFVREANADSLTMGFAKTRAAVRMRTEEVTVQRSNGYYHGRSTAGGALIGALAVIGLFLSTPDLQTDDGMMAGVLLVPASVALGGVLGFAMAPERWQPLSTGTQPCGWRRTDGTSPNIPIVSRGKRRRMRGAFIGGLALGSIAIIRGVSHPELTAVDVFPIVVGDAAIGAVIGSFFGPREMVRIPASCP